MRIELFGEASALLKGVDPTTKMGSKDRRYCRRCSDGPANLETAAPEHSRPLLVQRLGEVVMVQISFLKRMQEMFADGSLQPIGPDLIPADETLQARDVAALAQSAPLNSKNGSCTHS